VGHIASSKLDKPSYIESPLRLQHGQLPAAQPRHYIFTADDYQGGYNGSTSSKKGSNKSLPPPPPPPPVNSNALFQKFRLQQHQQEPYSQLQQQQQQQQHLEKQEYSSIASPSTEKRRRMAFSKQQSDTSVQENVKVCSRCRTSNSPEWRRGPDGHKT
jgi:hypothetical protein